MAKDRVINSLTHKVDRLLNYEAAKVQMAGGIAAEGTIKAVDNHGLLSGPERAYMLDVYAYISGGVKELRKNSG